MSESDTITIYNSSELLASELANNCLSEIKSAYATALTRTDAAKILKGEPCAFRVRVTVEKMEPKPGKHVR